MSQRLCIVLGFFELFMAVDFYLNAEKRVLENTLIPNVAATSMEARVMYCTLIMMLGFQRLTYATSKATFISWIWLLCTHVVEAAFWWVFAMDPSFSKGLPLDQLLTEVVTLKTSAGFHAPLVLLGPGLLVLFFALHGPPKQHKTDKQGGKHE